MAFLNRFFLFQAYFVNFFGDIYFIPILALFLIGAIFVFDRHKREFLIIVLSMLSFPFSILLKFIFREERPSPELFFYNSIYDFYSFPSSHVIYYVSFWGYILYLCFRMKHENKLIRTLSGVFSLYMISMIGISRVVIGVHFPKDVIAGYFFGAAFLALLILIDLSLKRFRTDDNTDLLKLNKLAGAHSRSKNQENNH